MTYREIRAEIVELINGGMLKLPLIVSYFKTHKPSADIKVVKEEAKEILEHARKLSKRG
jgi:hypothetical protein